MLGALRFPMRDYERHEKGRRTIMRPGAYGEGQPAQLSTRIWTRSISGKRWLSWGVVGLALLDPRMSCFFIKFAPFTTVQSDENQGAGKGRPKHNVEELITCSHWTVGVKALNVKLSHGWRNSSLCKSEECSDLSPWKHQLQNPIFTFVWLFDSYSL